MLKYRLIFGILMSTAFVGLVILDGWMDGSLAGSPSTDRPQATLVALLLCLLAIPTQLEMAGLAGQTGASVFKEVTIPGSMLLATAFYWRHFSNHPTRFFCHYLLFTMAAIVVSLFLTQAIRKGYKGTIQNCGASLLATLYLGFLSGFVLGIRTMEGPWTLLLFIFTVKSSDIGAYTAGRLFGKHKLIPSISPGKTWEGLAGGILLAAIVCYGFSAIFDILSAPGAILFGAVFAVLGQLADLAESMIKRDAAQKDSSRRIPGFGGLLDVFDSLLLTAPLAYAVFRWMHS